jgi:ABC-type branched-subunit amino acid transport system substrate-binding protein
MPAKHRELRFVLSLSVALGGAAGCLVVYPLEDLPAASGKSAGGEAAGGTSPTGGVPAGGAPGGEAGDGTIAGSSGNSGEQCQTNAECVRQNEDVPYRCRPSDHTCVTLLSDTCVLAYGDFKDPNAVYFGAFASFNPTAPADSNIVWAHLLALDELGKAGGLPGEAAGTHRPLVMIVCDNADDFVKPGLSHLAEHVQVPAIIATLKPDDLQRGFSTYRTHHDIFYLSPVSVTNTVATAPDDNLVWSMLGQPSDMAPTYVELLKLQEKRLRKDPKWGAEDKLKVVLVTTKTGFDAELADAVTPLLRFNGTSVEGNSTNYFPVTLDPNDSDLEATAQNIANFGPDVVISAASELLSMENGLLETVENIWKLHQSDKSPPFYILSPYNAGDLGRITELMNGYIEFAVEADPQLRFVGVSIADPRDNTLQQAYAGRLRKLFSEAYVDTVNYYDATYFLAYAMYAAGPAELSGASIAQGMRRLLSGEKYNIGPGTIKATFSALANADASVHLASTLGPPGFDPETGVRPVEGGVLCFEKVGAKVQRRTDVLRYDVGEAALLGTFPCFSGFYP